MQPSHHPATKFHHKPDLLWYCMYVLARRALCGIVPCLNFIFDTGNNLDSGVGIRERAQWLHCCCNMIHLFVAIMPWYLMISCSMWLWCPIFAGSEDHDKPNAWPSFWPITSIPTCYGNVQSKILIGSHDKVICCGDTFTILYSSATISCHNSILQQPVVHST